MELRCTLLSYDRPSEICCMLARTKLPCFVKNVSIAGMLDGAASSQYHIEKKRRTELVQYTGIRGHSLV
jgi:hypothetical protein